MLSDNPTKCSYMLCLVSWHRVLKYHNYLLYKYGYISQKGKLFYQHKCRSLYFIYSFKFPLSSYSYIKIVFKSKKNVYNVGADGTFEKSRATRLGNFFDIWLLLEALNHFMRAHSPQNR